MQTAAGILKRSLSRGNNSTTPTSDQPPATVVVPSMPASASIPSLDRPFKKTNEKPPLIPPLELSLDPLGSSFLSFEEAAPSSSAKDAAAESASTAASKPGPISSSSNPVVNQPVKDSSDNTVEQAIPVGGGGEGASVSTNASSTSNNTSVASTVASGAAAAASAATNSPPTASLSRPRANTGSSSTTTLRSSLKKSKESLASQASSAKMDAQPQRKSMMTASEVQAQQLQQEMQLLQLQQQQLLQLQQHQQQQQAQQQQQQQSQPQQQPPQHQVPQASLSKLQQMYQAQAQAQAQAQNHQQQVMQQHQHQHQQHQQSAAAQFLAQGANTTTPTSGRVPNGALITRSQTLNASMAKSAAPQAALAMSASASTSNVNQKQRQQGSSQHPHQMSTSLSTSSVLPNLSSIHSVSSFPISPSPVAASPAPTPPVQVSVSPSPSPSGGLRLPLSAEATLHYYRDMITPYEQREIFDYPEIWFVGAVGIVKIGSARRRTGADGLPPGTVSREDETGYFNEGYDDSHGDYYLTPHDHIGYRYEIVSLLGKGSFGQVARCFDHKTKTYVAVKIIRNKKRFEKQGVVEVKVLDRVRREDKEDTYNVIHMLDSFYFRHHLVITFELLGMNLYEWIKAGGFRGVHSGVIKRFTVQIVECLMMLHKSRIVHCDMKPENILLRDPTFTHPHRCDLIASSSDSRAGRWPAEFDPTNRQYDIKTIDFGSACFEPEKIYTYVQSRFYRSPEVILGIPYTVAIDMWSLGCIVAEMLTGYPLFPGENEQEQLACIMEIRGVPPEYLVEKGSRRRLFFETNGSPRPYTSTKGKKRRPGNKNLQTVLRYADPVILNFIERCLEWDPEKRMVPQEAMRHEWLRDFVGLGRSSMAAAVRASLEKEMAAAAQQRALEEEKRRQQEVEFLLQQQQQHQMQLHEMDRQSQERAFSATMSDASRATVIESGSNVGTPSTNNTWKALNSWRKSFTGGKSSEEMPIVTSVAAATSSSSSKKTAKKPSSLKLSRSKSHSNNLSTPSLNMSDNKSGSVPAMPMLPPKQGSNMDGMQPAYSTSALSAGPIVTPVFTYSNHNGPAPPPPLNTALLANLAAMKDRRQTIGSSSAPTHGDLSLTAMAAKENQQQGGVPQTPQTPRTRTGRSATITSQSGGSVVPSGLDSSLGSAGPLTPVQAPQGGIIPIATQPARANSSVSAYSAPASELFQNYYQQQLMLVQQQQAEQQKQMFAQQQQQQQQVQQSELQKQQLYHLQQQQQMQQQHAEQQKHLQMQMEQQQQLPLQMHMQMQQQMQMQAQQQQQQQLQEAQQMQMQQQQSGGHDDGAQQNASGSSGFVGRVGGLVRSFSTNGRRKERK